MSTKTRHRSGETLRRYVEYKQEYPIYKRLCEEAETQIREMLERRGIPVASIDWRVKSFYSMSEHLAKKPVRAGKFMKALRDTAGVRIVVWRPTDGAEIAKDIHKSFKVLPGTKEASLGSKASGYRDSKYYCSIRMSKRVPRDLSGLIFELQIQTALMNTWASIEHDVAYKGPYELPDEYKNRFKLLAYLMDLGDDNLNRLTEDVILDAKQHSKTKLNTLGLKAHLDDIVGVVDTKEMVLRVFRDWADARRLVTELRKCGIRRLDDLRRIINQDVVNRLAGMSRGTLDYSSLVRLVLMMKSLRSYFSRVMYEDIILEESWLPILELLNVKYIEAARAVDKRIYVDTGEDCIEIRSNKKNGHK
jgi:ppGpp synthetase/RelA/SpoT-type nucleotidyltranferase